MPARRVIGLRFWRNDDHQTTGLLGSGSSLTQKPPLFEVLPGQ